MVTFRSLASRFSALFRRQELDDRVDEELEFHIGMQTEENIRQGMTPVDARTAARRNLGNTTQVREDVHRMNTISLLEETVRNVQVSLRTLVRNPGFALAAVLVLALGLGASSAMFSALDRILFRPLPYGDADRLVVVGMVPATDAPGRVLNIHAFSYQEHWKPAPEPFTAVTSTWNGSEPCDVTEQQPERLRCAQVQSNFLQTFGVRPALGRDFTVEDDVRGAPSVAIISHDIWTRRFGADAGVIGRTIDLNGKPIRVIGVLPAGFANPEGETDILWPGRPDGGVYIRVFGRLKPGITRTQAEAAIAPLIEAYAKGNGVGIRGGRAKAQPRVMPLRDYLAGDASRVAWLLLGAVAGLLLIACINVTNLILARMAARDREFAVRSALGAGRARLARLALTESMLMAVAGGGLGLLFAAAMLRVFVQLAPSNIPEIRQASLDLRVFAVAAVLAVVAGTAVGIWPALSVLRSRALQYGARATAAPRPRMRFMLVTVQIGLTVAMLASSALLLRTLWNLVAVPLGYESERVVTMNVDLLERYAIGSRGPFFERLLERIHEIPGTAVATMSNTESPTGVSLLSGTVSVDRPGNTPPGSLIRLREVTPGYFHTFAIPIVRGRTFAETDRTGQPVAILSESAAQILFPGQDPIGHTVDAPSTNGWAEIVGIAREIRNTGPTREPEPELYTPWRRDRSDSSRGEFFSSTAFFAIRTQAGTADAVAFLKQSVVDLDPQLPVTIEPLKEEVARLTERPRFVAWLLSAFAGLALLLAAAGLYGVASYLVTQRTRDIGVRIALGAAPADISRQVVAEAGRWIAAGAVLGCTLAWAGTRAIEAQLYGVSSRDPLSWIAALGVLCAALLFAVLRPAARAARVDPMEALRAD
jgi:predicted permease